MAARIRFGKEICGNPAKSLRREWLETNGIGGFASSTAAGANTRRYHGLLVAATVPPPGRHVLLSKVEETLVVDGGRFELSTNLYPGVTHPAGYRFLTELRLDPYPVFVFEAGGVRIEKRLCLVDGENTLVLEYAAEGKDCALELRPLVAFRGYHELMHAGTAWNGSFTGSDGRVTIEPRAGLPRLHFAHGARRIAGEGNWYFNFEYPIERERGFDDHEDLFCPFVLEYDAGPGRPAALIVSTEEHRAEEAQSLQARERARREGLSAATPAAISSDQFIVRRGKRRTVIAGYPWFGEWFRDTLISLPGLTLATKRFDIAREILAGCVECLNEGMLPNRFPDGSGEPEYNTVDATLWLFEAVRKYLEYTGDQAFIREKLRAPLEDVIAWHVRGTRFGIVMDADGLLRAGDSSTQLTWMDARINGWPATPRHGRAVEIQALWYNALRIVEKLTGAERYGKMDQYGKMADRTATSFAQTFWNAEAGCFYDVVDGDRRDASVRPNQVIALSLGYGAVAPDRARSILRVVREKLLTPYGLRTLAPDDPRYRGRYEGSPAERDGAYHQGTVWPWLLGPYISARIRFDGDEARREGAEIVRGLRKFMQDRGAGQLPEIFDGDAPHEPRGCFAQAWSVAEIGRVAAEYFAGGDWT